MDTGQSRGKGRARIYDRPLWQFEQFVDAIELDADGYPLRTDWRQLQREREMQARRRRAAVALLVGAVTLAAGYVVGAA